MASQRQLSRCVGSVDLICRLPGSNQCAQSEARRHFMISGQVAVVICGPVLAVTRMRVSVIVVRPQSTNQADIADFPGPTPPATAILIGVLSVPAARAAN